MEIINKIDNYNQQTKEFVTSINEFVKDMATKSKVFQALESLKYMTNDRVWVLDHRQVDKTGRLTLDAVHIRPRAQFNGPGSVDNRLTLTAESLLTIEQQTITAIAYGDPADSYFNRNEGKPAWWYKFGYGAWVTEDMVGLSKQEVLDRWAEKCDMLRDDVFAKHYKTTEEERQRKINDAKRLLENEGQI